MYMFSLHSHVDSRVEFSAPFLLYLLPELKGLVHHSHVVGLDIGSASDPALPVRAASRVKPAKLETDTV